MSPPIPPVPVRDLPLGFDINQDNGDRTEGLTEFAALKQVGKIFGIAKLAQAGVDQAFDTRYPLIRDAGMIRGSYDFFAPVDVGDQIAFVVDHVKRLTPGDLAPAIDLEDGSRALDRKYNYSSSAAGRNSLFVDISTWLDAVEARLGRAPIIYTGVLWREQFNAANFPNLPDMSVYPLWTAHPIPVAEDDHASGEVLNGCSDYTFWQYAEDKRGDKKKGAPARLWGIDPYIEPGTERFDGIDYNAFNGSIYGLRGLADLGHTAPHVAGNRESIAYAAPDGNLHLLEWAAGAWSDQDLSSAGPVAAQGDPAAIATELEQVILYRTADGAVIALTRPLADVNAPWSVATIATDAIDDPFVVRIGNELHAAQAPPAATYRPTTYTPSGAAPRVVFRGVRGSIWQVERDTLAANNLTLAASAPAAAGSPSAVFTDRCYIIYRGTNGAINVIYDDAGTWRTGVVSPFAAADPTAYVDLNGNVAVSFFANDGVHVARLVNGTWV